MKKFARYKYVTVPVSEQSAKRDRRDEVENLEGRIDELEKELEELLKSPLPKTRKKQITFYPGQKGYDKLPSVFNPIDWQGDTTWTNIK